MVTFIAQILGIAEAFRAPQQGGGLCQGAPASARAQPPIEACFLGDFRDFHNIGASFTGP
jgi:hypothetical protein